MTEDHILNLLKCRRHSDDIFVPHCKDGPSGEGVAIFDGWAMNKSWVNMCFTGYEIKVDRSDFLNDNKWIKYLPSCNQFYFVCPPGVVSKEEIPEQAGFLQLSSTGSRLFTKKKAPFRKIEVPVFLLLYVLMGRVCIQEEYSSEVAKWRAWLEQKEESQKIGWDVSRKLRRIYHRDVEKVRAENRSLKTMIDGLSDVQKMCESLGVTTTSVWDIQHNVRHAISKLGADGLLRDIRGLISNLSTLDRKLSEYMEEVKNGQDSSNS